jgi:hypothetical protein
MKGLLKWLFIVVLILFLAPILIPFIVSILRFIQHILDFIIGRIS